MYLVSIATPTRLDNILGPLIRNLEKCTEIKIDRFRPYLHTPSDTRLFYIYEYKQYNYSDKK